jgi:hypothetical protein
MRKPVEINGRWVKSVKWADGDGLRPKSIQLTARREEAIAVLPETAEAILKVFSPEAVRRAKALRAAIEQEATRFMAHLVVERLARVDPKYRAEVADILKELL